MARIYLVEDDVVVALDLCSELEALGHTIVGRSDSPDEAIKLVKELAPDLVLMDIGLPGPIDGIDAASTIKSSFAIPVVFLTAYTDDATLQRAKAVSPDGFIIKPFNADDLRVAITLALSRRADSVPARESSQQPEEDARPFSCTLSDVATVEGRVKLLSSLPILRNLSVGGLQLLAQGSSLKTLSAGDVIVHEGLPLNDGFLVLQGRLSVLKVTSTGKELTLELLSPGDITGILRCVSGSLAQHSVRAQVNCQILSIPSKTLCKALEEQPRAYGELLEKVAERLRRLGELALSLAHDSVEERILATLVALAPRLGKPGAHPDEVRIFLTRKELADLTGTTNETAIRVTKSLERSGLLELSKPGIIKVLSVSALQDAIQQCAAAA